jgi:hypothetical protein
MGRKAIIHNGIPVPMPKFLRVLPIQLGSGVKMKYEDLKEIVLVAYHIGKNDGTREQVEKLLREVEL